MNEIFSLFDSKAEYYMPPFFERNANTAVRAVEAAMATDNHPIYKNAEDYSLFHVGSWDQETGRITSEGPRHVTDCWVIRAKLTNTPKED